MNETFNLHSDTNAAPSATDELQAQLQSLRVAYASRLPEKIARLCEICRASLEANADEKEVALNRDARNMAHRLAHNLAGSGATYGFTDLGALARQLELALLECGDGDNISSRDAEKLRALFDELESELSRIASGAEASAPDAPQVLASHSSPAENHIGPESDAWRQALQEATRSDNDNRLIFLAATDANFGKELAQQIGYFGYKVCVSPLASNESSMASLESLSRALVRDRPAALIISESPIRGDEECPVLDTSETTFSSAHIANAVRRNGVTLETLPLVFLSHCADMETRLRAVRAGRHRLFHASD